MASKTLGEINQVVTLAVNLGQILTPVITGLVKDLKAKQNADGSIEYTVVISTGQDNLNSSVVNFNSSLDFINTELAKQAAPLMEKPAFVTAVHNPTPAVDTPKDTK